MSLMKKHFVCFYSPGTFVAETNEKPIDKWDVDKAVTMAGAIIQRYNARPYGFRFTTRERADDEWGSREVAAGPMYFLGGTVHTLAEIKARNDPTDRILISNMEINGYARVVTNDNSWRWTQPLNDDDVVLDVTLPAPPPEKG